VVEGMANIDDLIEYYDENLNLDFKGSQYTRDEHADLIKDIIAMANADTNDECYIIIGVIHNNGGQKELRGISREGFIDDAVYQQLIRENVEPDIKFEYSLYEYAGKCFGVFKIGNCDDKPYMMKKEYNKLKKGDSWIRKGTHQPRMIRRDFDAIYERKLVSIGFNGDIEILFEENESDSITVPTVGEFTLPSEREARSILRAIEEKKNPSAKKPTILDLYYSSGLDLPYALTGIKPYHKRTLEELEENLRNVSKDFAADDAYFRFEENGYKFNIILHNKGEQYIEDGRIRVHIPKVDGLLVAPEVTVEPYRDSYGFNTFIYPEFRSKYPEVIESEKYTVIMESVGDIKHHSPILAFEEPVRIFFNSSLQGESIEIECEIFGKNLKKPITKILNVHLKAPIQADDKDDIS
jgi:hypothetical protein